MTVGHRERGGAPAHENSPDVINVLNAVIDPLPLVGNVETPFKHIVSYLTLLSPEKTKKS